MEVGRPEKIPLSHGLDKPQGDESGLAVQAGGGALALGSNPASSVS